MFCVVANCSCCDKFAVQFPQVSARCVHWTFDQCLQILFNTAPSATLNPRKQHTDGVSSRCEPGLLGYIQSYLGIVEPQMRKTEHIHKLIQVLGFSHPRQFFKNGNFVDLFRRLWSYVASVSFTSQEACAVHIDETNGLDVLKQEPIMPVFPGQLKKIGHEVEQESI